MKKNINNLLGEELKFINNLTFLNKEEWDLHHHQWLSHQFWNNQFKEINKICHSKAPEFLKLNLTINLHNSKVSERTFLLHLQEEETYRLMNKSHKLWAEQICKWLNHLLQEKQEVRCLPHHQIKLNLLK